MGILDQIEEGWGMASAIELMEKTDVVLENIIRYPLMYQASAKGGEIRRAVITRRTSVIYKVYEDRIDLIAFRDNMEGD
ncbi:MAG: hypothetical protein ACPG5P_08120 [Saprospiraceae bacterium]